MILRKTLLAICLFFLAFSSQARADLILGNTFTGSTDGTNPFTAGQQTDANISSIGVTRFNYTPNGGNNALVAGELRTSDGAIDFSTRYFSFDITPINGATVDFTDFTYLGFQTIFDQGSANGGTLGATKFDFRSSIDGFSSSIPGANLLGTTINLSGSQFQGITAPVEFRLYIQSDFTGESPNSTYSLDEFEFNGTITAVPEPSSMLMFSIVAGFGLFRRKR